MESLLETFDRFFEVVPAVTEEQLRQVFALRYQVYCLETGFENIDEHPDGMEQDEYDHRAVHSLLMYRDTGQVAGTVRLVLPNLDNVDEPFPIEQHCGPVIKRPIAGGHRAELAEISRFCISKQFKRRMAESQTLWGNAQEDPDLAERLAQRRMIPHITVGLFAAIVRMSAEHGIRYWYAVMEPSLLRFLQRFGIHFESIGPLTNYHGERQPCFALSDQVLGSMRHECYPVWELITGRGTHWPPEGKRPLPIPGKVAETERGERVAGKTG